MVIFSLGLFLRSMLDGTSFMPYPVCDHLSTAIGKNHLCSTYGLKNYLTCHITSTRLFEPIRFMFSINHQGIFFHYFPRSSPISLPEVNQYLIPYCRGYLKLLENQKPTEFQDYFFLNSKKTKLLGESELWDVKYSFGPKIAAVVFCLLIELSFKHL